MEVNDNLKQRPKNCVDVWSKWKTQAIRYRRTRMEAKVKELQQKLEKQCQINQELQNEKQYLELSQRFSTDKVEVRQSRAAVMAPEPIPDDMDISTTRVKKTASEKAQIIKAMQKNDFLSRLDEEQISMMVELLTSLDCCPGDEIIKEGTEGDSMYIVAAGELQVTQAGRILRTLTSGDVFGELAILYNCKRTATVKAVKAVKLWCIERQIYRSIMAIKSKKKREQLIGFLKTARTFKSLSDELLSSIIDSMEEVKFQENEVIVREGAEGDTFYIILKGEVQVTKKVNGQQKIIRKLGQGDHFGELALIRLHGTFKDSRYIYMVMDFCSGGEIWTKLKEVRCFEENIAVFVAACVVEAYAYLHKKDIMYRDLKPENLMLDSRGYVKLVDFGFAKKLRRGQKTYSFCGTPEYMAPEIIQNQGHDFAADFWSLGVLIYELLAGSPPFSSTEPQKIYSKILDGVIRYPSHMGESARSLISKLCRPRQGQRLGNTKNGIKDVRNHRWFNNMNWHKLRMRQITAPTVKLIRKGPCYINFDRFPFDKNLAEEDFSSWDRDF
ncbi:cGMP-dependent protein kinase 1 [Bagarius yarrelli]|uniref:cGMP-dependent protein kinase n=1 Tax=Bagarius yarrelli TaxID=175774 RepID=A0A556TZC7_BAGYA|nr:cGMP-dependent protein kinase 1 [Bagarius yarrelli]